MVVSCKEFAYTTDAQFQADMTAWFSQLKLAGTPARDFRINYITTSRVLVTATYGLMIAGEAPPAVPPPAGNQFTSDTY